MSLAISSVNSPSRWTNPFLSSSPIQTLFQNIRVKCSRWFFSLFLILTGISSGNSLQKNWFFVSQAIQLLGYGIKCKWTIWLDVDWFKWCRSRICEFGSRRDIPTEFHRRLKIHLERYSKKCSLATVEFTGKWMRNELLGPTKWPKSLIGNRWCTSAK